MSLAVLGTDTGVGKTLVSALLLERYGRQYRLAYWKPVATGSRDERDTETVASLVTAPYQALDESHLLPEPLSPHLAARRAGVRINAAGILADWRRHQDGGGRGRGRGRELVVEGAGGLLVPLDDAGTLLVDVVAAMDLPALVVARSSLGTINHTLLTLEALRARQVAIAGVVLVGPRNADNRDAIAAFGRVAVLAEVPPLARVDAATIAAAAVDFDREANLAASLGAPG